MRRIEGKLDLVDFTTSCVFSNVITPISSSCGVHQPNGALLNPYKLKQKKA